MEEHMLIYLSLFYRKQIWSQARRSIHEQNDIHARLMSRYPQVPNWWFIITFGESPKAFLFESTHN